jgi:hypothetical protein
MTFEEFDKSPHNLPCDCGCIMHLQLCVPAIKTEMRLEDYWKKHGILDPEDSEHKKLAAERIKMMREEAKKKKEKELEKLGDKARLRRINIQPDSRSIKDLPRSHKGRTSINKDDKNDKPI